MIDHPPQLDPGMEVLSSLARHLSVSIECFQGMEVSRPWDKTFASTNCSSGCRYEYLQVQRRIQTLEQAATSMPNNGTKVDSFLSPLTIDEKNDALGACANQARQRCSDKGFLSMSTMDYLELLDAMVDRYFVQTSNTSRTSSNSSLGAVSINLAFLALKSTDLIWSTIT